MLVWLKSKNQNLFDRSLCLRRQSMAHRGQHCIKAVLASLSKTVIGSAGVGDKFPVQEEGKPVLFEVAVIPGDDNQLSVEVRSKEKTQKITVVRDKRTIVESGGVKYELLYPSTSKAAKEGEKPTTNQVMLIITREP